MSRKRDSDLVPKTIGGANVSQDAFKKAITEAVGFLGRATTMQVAEFLGPEWSTQRATLGWTMRNMIAAKSLARNADGYYVLAEFYDAKELHSFSTDVVKAVRDLGGIAYTKEILAVFDVRQKGHFERTGENVHNAEGHRRVTAVLSHKKPHPILRRYYKDGVWGLRDLSNAVVPGFWRRQLMVWDWSSFTSVKYHTMEYAEAPDDLVRDLFWHIGSTFESLRKYRDLTFEELLQDSGIKDAVLEFTNPFRAHHLTESAEVYETMRTRAKVRAAAEKREADQEYIRKLAARDRRENLGVRILEQFEKGAFEMHLAAPVDFYIAYAKYFDLKPAELSRGEVARESMDERPIMRYEDEGVVLRSAVAPISDDEFGAKIKTLGTD